MESSGGGNPFTDLIPQHAIASGGGALPADSVGFPWNGRFIVASGNLLADFRSNLHAESQGLIQAVRLYEMTDDAGVKDHLSYMIARDTMHRNQWLAAIEDLKTEGLETTVVVPSVAYEYGKPDAAYQFWNNSQGEESAEGRWAKGPSIDGRGEFEYIANPQPLGPEPELPQPNPQLHGTPKTPHASQISAKGGPNVVDRVVEVIDRLTPGGQQ